MATAGKHRGNTGKCIGTTLGDGNSMGNAGKCIGTLLVDGSSREPLVGVSAFPWEM